MTSYYSNLTSASNFVNKILIKNSKQQPIDTVQVVVNDPYRTNDHAFAAGGWDGVLRYYRIVLKTIEEIQLCYEKFLEHPILSLSFGKGHIVFAGLATGDIVAVDMASDQSGVIGTHQAPICKLFWLDNFSLLMSFGFDNKMNFWNIQNTGNFLAKQFDLPSKTHTAALDYPYLLIGTADSKMALLNLNTLPNLQIPDQNGLFNIIQMGSKFQCSKIIANKMIYAFGCVDGRCIYGAFQDNTYGLRPHPDSTKKTNSKSMKREVSYNHSPMYGQINDLDMGIQGNQEYLILTGSEEIAFFNIIKRDKPKRIKVKGTVGRLSIDGKYFIWAEGNDWCEGINELKKPLKPRIQAVKFSKSEIQSFISKT